MSPLKLLTAPTARTSAFFLSLMMPAAVAGFGLALWLADRGASDEQIGLVNALPLAAVVVLGLFVGRLADRSANWRGAILACCAITAPTPLLLAWTHAYWAVALIWTLVMVPFHAMTPLADAAAIRVATQTGGSYGAIRVWATIGFVLVIFLAGLAFQARGVAAFVPMLLAASLARLAAAIALPDLRAREPPGGAGKPKRPFAVDASHDLRELMRPWFLAPVLGGALLGGSHIVQNGFGPLIWKSQGVSDGLIGLYLAIAPTAEIGAMLLSHRVLARFPARVVLLGCCLVGAFRWCGYATPLGPVAIGLLQVLHLVTFGLGYVAMVVFVDAWSHATIGAQAQSFATLARNLVAIVGYLAFGALTALIGARVFYVAAGMCAVGAILCAGSLAIKPARRLG